MKRLTYILFYGILGFLFAGISIASAFSQTLGWPGTLTITTAIGAASSTPYGILDVGGAASFNQGTSTLYSALMVGTAANNASLFGTSTIGQFSTSTNNFAQVVLQNTNTGTDASADYVVGGDLMTNSVYYGDFGCNGHLFNQPTFTGESGNDCFMQSSDSNLDIETASSTGPASIKFLTAGTMAANIRMVILPTGLAGIGTTTPIAQFQVATSTANATTSLEFGSAGQNKGTCIKLYRTDGSAIYAFVAAGATSFTLTTTACASIANF